MRNTHTSKQTSKRNTHTFCRIFGALSLSINKILLEAQIKEYNTNLSAKPSRYDGSQNNIITKPTAPQLKNINHNHPLSLVPQNFRNIALTNLITSRYKYPQSPIQHIITQKLIAQLPTQPTYRATSPSSHSPSSLPIIPSSHHHPISRMESETKINTTVYNNISQLNHPDIKTPDQFANSEPSPSRFSQPPSQPIHSQVKTVPPSPPSSISSLTPTYSPLTSEPSDNNSSPNTQISNELENFTTLQQQLQPPQTLTIHQHSQSSNPSTTTSSSHYTLRKNQLRNQSHPPIQTELTEPLKENF